MKSWNTVERQFNPVEARYRWLAFGVLTMEAAIPFKFVGDAGNLIKNPGHPPLLVFGYALLIFVMFAFYIGLGSAPWRTKKFITLPQEEQQKKKKEKN